MFAVTCLLLVSEKSGVEHDVVDLVLLVHELHALLVDALPHVCHLPEHFLGSRRFEDVSTWKRHIGNDFARDYLLQDRFCLYSGLKRRNITKIRFP